MTKHFPDASQSTDSASTKLGAATIDRATLRAYVEEWVKKNQRRVAAGLGATILALPLVAQAQDAGGMVDASALDGVQSVTLNSDGSALITLTNGQQVQVPASAVQVAADGTIMISAAAAETVATAVAAMAAPVGAGAIAAMVGGIGIVAAASGGDGSSAAGTPTPFLNLAAVTNESPVSFADLFGDFTFQDGDEVSLQIGELIIPVEIKNGNIIFPEGVDFSDVQGPQQIDFTVLRSNLVPEVDEDGEPVLGEDGEPVFVTETEEITGGAQVIIDTIPPELTITTPIAGDDVLNAAEQQEDLEISGTAEGAEGQEVEIQFGDATYTATVAEDGTWSLIIPAADLAELESGEEVTILANVSDAAGNPAPEAEAVLATDFIAEITIDDVSIETINTFTGVTVTGDTDGVEEWQTVTLSFDGEDYTGSVEADGSWSVTIPREIIEALETDTDVQISASVTDLAGNPAEAETAATTDFSTPALGILSPADGDFINAADAEQPLEVSGVALPGETVIVTLAGNERETTADEETGAWSVTFEPADLPDEDGELTIAATSTIEGVEVDAEITLTLDTTPPEISITTPVAGDDIINIAERDEGITIEGATDAEDGQVVTVTFDGQTYQASVENNAWSVQIPSDDLLGLESGQDIDITADVSDLAGNPAEQAAVSITTDFSIPEIEINSLGDTGAGDTFTAADLVDAEGEDLGTLTLSGSTNAPEDATVSIILGSQTLEATVQANGDWSADVPTSVLSAEFGNLDEIAISASVQNPAGNVGTAELPILIDLSIPSVTIDASADGFVIGLDEFENGLVISGTTENVPDGQEVTIFIGEDADDEEAFEATALVTDGMWSLEIPAETVQGAVDETALILSVSVSDGVFPIPATATINVSTDFPPEITLDPLGEDGALVLAELADSITFSGSTRGVQEGQEVTLFSEDGDGIDQIDTDEPILVQADGTWSVTINNPDIEGVELGQEFTFIAQVANASGRAAPEASTSAVIYDAATLYIAGGTPVTAGVAAGALEFAFFLDPRFEFDENELIAEGFPFALGETVFFNTDVVSYVPIPAPQYASGLTGATNVGEAANGEITLAAVGFLSPTDPETGEDVDLYTIPFARFRFNHDNTDEEIVFSVDSQIGGRFDFIFGTDDDDTISASNFDTVIRGGGGDDEIDLSAPGVNTVLFEGGSVANGFDTITGFTLGGALADRFGIVFDEFGQDALRGDGSAFQVTDGGPVGDNVGLLVFTTAIDDFSNATIEAALSGLTGLADQDSLYLLIGDGTDAELTAVEFEGGSLNVGTGSGTSYARFEGIGDLSGFSDANVLGFEQHNA